MDPEEKHPPEVKSLILKVLTENNHNVSQTARILGISRDTAYRALRGPLHDLPKRPKHCPKETPHQLQDLILSEAKRTGFRYRTAVPSDTSGRSSKKDQKPHHLPQTPQNCRPCPYQVPIYYLPARGCSAGGLGREHYLTGQKLCNLMGKVVSYEGRRARAEEAVIVSGVRTPIGRYGDPLS
ncbi:MAG: hypothetical protein DRG40_06745 [Deltaproteobacteria bacterium]|nr:MAG: hypothetical protein DRG40_06745 [Deltaproteobacteria bacterium]